MRESVGTPYWRRPRAPDVRLPPGVPGREVRRLLALIGDGGPEGRKTPNLPTGFVLDETDRELAVLRRGDGSQVATCSSTGEDPRGAKRRAWEGFGKRRGAP